MTILDIKKISKTYKTGSVSVEAVRSISIKVKRGEVILIMGPSGSGKTTLLSMAGGLLRPTSGQIIMDKVDLGSLEEKKLAKIRLHKIGFIFQSFNLLSSLTAFENVMLVGELVNLKNGVAKTKAKKILEELGLKDRMFALPEDLSGGEKQRVAIARSLMNDPVIIFADEPTANLDSKTGHIVMDQLKKLAKEHHQKSVVIVSHDDRIKSIADRILLIEDGMLKNKT